MLLLRKLHDCNKPDGGYDPNKMNRLFLNCGKFSLLFFLSFIISVLISHNLCFNLIFGILLDSFNKNATKLENSHTVWIKDSQRHKYKRDMVRMQCTLDNVHIKTRHVSVHFQFQNWKLPTRRTYGFQLNLLLVWTTHRLYKPIKCMKSNWELHTERNRVCVHVWEEGMRQKRI